MAKKIREIEVEYPDCTICGNEISGGEEYFDININLGKITVGESGGGTGIRSGSDPPIPATSCGASWLPVSQNTYRILHRLEVPPARRYYVPFLTQFGFTCNRDRTVHELSRPCVP